MNGPNSVMLCGNEQRQQLAEVLGRYGVTLNLVPDNKPIPGSWFGDPEAGIIGREVFVRRDTPLHSALHESCHLICIDEGRRAVLHTDAGGDYDEENGVNYLEITLSDYLPCLGRDRLMADMDAWGYTFRLGSARAWFEEDAEDARQWLLTHGLITDSGEPTWQLRR